VATAFAQDSGDVIDASALGSLYSYGAHQNKSLAVATDFGIGSAYHISGTGGVASSGNSATLGFSSISGGVPNEHVVALGVTALSIGGRDYGNVTATARLAGGGTLSATRHINDATNAGDTFYGLTAPSIASDTSGPRCAARLSNVPGA